MTVVVLLPLNRNHAALTDVTDDLLLLSTQTRPLTCFLLIYVRPVKIPARQHGSVPFVTDPQTWFQPQVCLHLGKRSQLQCRSFNFSPFLETAASWNSDITSPSGWQWNASKSSLNGPGELVRRHICVTFHLKRPTYVVNPNNSRFPLRSLPADTCFICMLHPDYAADWLLAFTWRKRTTQQPLVDVDWPS